MSRPPFAEDRPRRPVTDARVELAAAVRDLVHAAVASDADDADLAAATVSTRAAVDLLRAHPWRRREAPDYDLLSENWGKDGERAHHIMADRPVAGIANPTAVEIEMRLDRDAIVADVVFGPAFEGAPGRVHGGILAAVFDDLLGATAAMIRQPSFTGRLTIEFVAPVPIETPIEVRGTIAEREGRKVFARAEARYGDTVAARAEALFITVATEHFATQAHELVEDRD